MTAKKLRLPIPAEVAAQLLYQSDRTCCVCNVPGKPIQIHHIDENPANNALANLSVLCLDCHNETMVKGGFGRRLDAHQIMHYKEDWLTRVLERKKNADNLASISKVVDNEVAEVEYRTSDDWDVLIKYLNKILVIHNAQLLITSTKWDDEGTTYSMKMSCYDMIDFYEEVFIELASFYPPNHFGASPAQYIKVAISDRYSWHTLIMQPHGLGNHGSILGVNVAGAVQYDVKRMIADIASTLIYDFDLTDRVTDNWTNAWLNEKSNA